MPARYILRLTLWLKFSSGDSGKSCRRRATAGSRSCRRGRGRCPSGATASWSSGGPRCDPSARACPARVGLIGDHDLVHQRLVVFAAEHRVGRVEGAESPPLSLISLQFHGALTLSAALEPACRPRCRRLRDDFLAGPRLGADDTSRPRAGNRALHQQQLALGVDAHDLEVLHGALDVAEVARHALARETRGPDPAPGRSSRARCARRELPWVARLDEKWWRLMTPAKPLPCVMPVHVDHLADLEHAPRRPCRRP